MRWTLRSLYAYTCRRTRQIEIGYKKQSHILFNYSKPLRYGHAITFHSKNTDY